MSDTLASRLDALAASLRESGLATSVDDVRDILWLAEVRGPAAPGPAPRVAGPVAAVPDGDPDRPEGAAAGTDIPITGTRSSPPRDEPALYASAQLGRIEAGMLRVPGIGVSPAPAELRRALQPLARRVPSTTRWQPNEEAIATHKAETGAWRLCQQPLRERWFDLNVIVEDSPSMQLWRPEVESFVRALKGQGGFRSLRRFTLSAQGPALLRTADGGRAAPLAALAPAGRRPLTLLMTDTGSAPWRSGAAQRFLFAAGTSMPLGVLQLLPARAWRHTALGEPDRVARMAHPGSPNSRLLPIGDGDEIDDGSPDDADRCLVPMLGLDPASICRWALAMAARTTATVPCAAVMRNAAPAPESNRGPAMTASEATAAFRRKVSRSAYDLAVFLTVPDPLTLPVMRLVQRTMLPDTGTGELAECLLGGVLVPTGEDAGAGSAVYRFRPGVREELVRGLRYSEENQVALQLARVGRTLEQAQTAGDGDDFTAYFPQPGGSARLSEWALPFATVSRGILQALEPPSTIPQPDAQSPAANAAEGDDTEAPDSLPAPAEPRLVVYLSAAQGDKPRLQPWTDALRETGVQVLPEPSPSDPSDGWSSRMRSGLMQAGCAIVAISSAWHISKWCRYEGGTVADRARNEPGFRVVPLRLDDSEMPAEFQHLLALDLRGDVQPNPALIHALDSGLRRVSVEATDATDAVDAADGDDAAVATEEPSPAPEPSFVDLEPQLLTIGSLIAEFRDGLDAATRRAVAASLLLAQLVADQSNKDDASVVGWYRRYAEVLTNTGWSAQGLVFNDRVLFAPGGGVRETVMPELLKMVGPSMASSSLVLSLLDGLEFPQAQTPGLQLFHRATEHASGARFQFAFIDADSDGNPDVRVLCIGIEAERALTAVLFFKSTDERAQIHHASGHFWIGRSLLESTRDAVAKRVASQFPVMVRHLEVGGEPPARHNT